MTRLELYNLALMKAGVSDLIQAMDETSAEQLACRTFFDVSRNHVLMAAVWRFAVKRFTADATATDERPFRYRVSLPADFLKIASVSFAPCVARDSVWTVCEDSGQPVLMATARPDAVAYVYDHDAVERWPAHFANAVASDLAYRIALPLSKDQRLSDKLFSMAQYDLNEAMLRDADNVLEHTPENHHVNRQYQ